MWLPWVRRRGPFSDVSNFLILFFFLFSIFGNLHGNQANESAHLMFGDGFVSRCKLGISIGNNEILRDRLVELVLDLKNLIVLDSMSAFFFEHRRFLPLNRLWCLEPISYHSIINFLLFVINHSLNKLILKNLFGRKSLINLLLEWRELDFRFFFLFILFSFLGLFR